MWKGIALFENRLVEVSIVKLYDNHWKSQMKFNENAKRGNKMKSYKIHTKCMNLTREGRNTGEIQAWILLTTCQALFWPL